MSEATLKQRNVNTVISWAALAISVVTMFIAIAAYNRSGIDLDQRVQNAIVDSTNSMERRIQLMQIQADLNDIQQRVNADETGEQIAADVDALQSRLQTLYSQSAEATSEQWENLDQQLSTLSDQLRAGSADALLSVEQSVAALRRLIDTENESA